MSVSAVSRLALGLIVAIAAPSTLALAQAPEPRLEAFRDMCVEDRQDYDKLNRRALTRGWVRTRDGAHAELDELLAISRELELEPDVSASLESYAKTIPGGEVFLVLTYYASPQIDLVGCYLYDFDTDTPVDADLVSDWLGTQPSETVDQPTMIVGNTWETPARLPGTWDVYLAFIPEGSPATALTGFSGVVIRISSVQPKET
jgi:hypothetical protein